jgi:hypothetical protein
MQTVSLSTTEGAMRFTAMIAPVTRFTAGGNMKRITKLALVFLALAFASVALAGEPQPVGQKSLSPLWARLAKPALKNATPVGTIKVLYDDDDDDDCTCCCSSTGAAVCTGGAEECRSDYSGRCVAKWRCGR